MYHWIRFKYGAEPESFILFLSENIYESSSVETSDIHLKMRINA